MADLRTGPGSSDPRDFTVVAAPNSGGAGIVFFSANDGVAGRELWRTDGTATGTWMVADLVPGSVGSLPSQLSAWAPCPGGNCGSSRGTGASEQLWFMARLPAGSGQLDRVAFSSDGSRQGTRRVNQATGPEVASLPPRAEPLGRGHALALPFRSSMFFPSWQGSGRRLAGNAPGEAAPPEVGHAAMVLDLEYAGAGSQPSRRLHMTVSAVGGLVSLATPWATHLPMSPSVSLDCTAPDCTAALRTLEFTAGRHSRGTATVNVSVHERRDSNSAAGAGERSAWASLEVEVLPVNSPPELGVPSEVISAQAGALHELPPIGLADADFENLKVHDAGSFLTILLEISSAGNASGANQTSGRLWLGSTAGLTLLQGTGAADARVCFSAGMEDSRRALLGLRAGCLARHGCLAALASEAGTAATTAVVRIQVTDNGFGGEGGPKQAAGELTIVFARPGQQA